MGTVVVGFGISGMSLLNCRYGKCGCWIMDMRNEVVELWIWDCSCWIVDIRNLFVGLWIWGM